MYPYDSNHLEMVVVSTSDDHNFYHNFVVVHMKMTSFNRQVFANQIIDNFYFCIVDLVNASSITVCRLDFNEFIAMTA